MLKLEKLVLSGFKSFSDRTEVQFPAGITAVVGPNGCGKSNIGDAINWVLGEQSPKLLRGRQMLDVIFSGSSARKPQGMAEVALEFVGAEGMPFAENGKIVLARRLFRSGDSDYLINGARARLKDIQELLREARIGTKTYSKIEQGRIDQVLNAKPKERRMMIEDAAGIAGYKHKRRLTEMKLEATEANLLRVNDIVTEVTRQINSVKRQASKARRYKRLREELRDRDRLRFALRAREKQSALERLRDAERQARDAEAAASAGLSKLEVELLERRGELQKAQDAFREASDRLHRLEIDIDREESQIDACKQRVRESESAAAQHDEDRGRLAARLEETRRAAAEHDARREEFRLDVERLREALARRQEALDAAERAVAERREALEQARKRQFETVQRAAELKNRLTAAREAVERDARQRARLEAERGAAQEDRSRLEDRTGRLAEESRAAEQERAHVEAAFEADETALGESRSRLAQANDVLGTARERQRSAQARLATLDDLATRFAGVSDGVRTLLARGAEEGVRTRGVVADFIQAGADVERAAEGYLQALLPTVILEDDSDVSRAAGMLRREGAGRTSFLCRSQPAGALAVGSPTNGSGPAPELWSDGRVRGRLRDRLRLDTALNGALQDRIGDAILVDSLESALELHRLHPGADYLTPDGDVVYASGLTVVAGDSDGDRGLLAHNRRIQEARSELAVAEEQADVELSRREELAARVEELDGRVRDGRRRLEELRSRELELRLQSEQSEEERRRTGKRTEVLADELAALAEQIERAQTEIEALAAECDAADRGHAGAARTLEAGQRELDEAEGVARREGDEVGRLRAELAAREQRAESADAEAVRLSEARADLEARIAQLAEQGASAGERAREAAALQESTQGSLMEHLAAREQLSGETQRMERDIGERRRALAEHEDRLRGDRGGLEELREATRAAELEAARAESDREHLEELCREELGLSTEDALRESAEELEQADLADLEERVAEIKGKIERLGPVNMTAIEEFSDLEERHTFLVSQREDLQRSMASLRESIRRINRQSREKFVEAFDRIRTSYQEIYKTLFNGGRADLRLEEGEDVLECGIEILAQPPGKRLAGVHLLSGGEKALSAIALLFAIFRYRPSPFCMLDEVDAALDEANVGRFSRMLREYSGNTQFIMVTHNKVSMEQADLLYGVTMEEPGVSKLVSMQLA